MSICDFSAQQIPAQTSARLSVYPGTHGRVTDNRQLMIAPKNGVKTMRLKELKEKVYSIWELVHTSKRTLIQPENFKPEIRTYGDLRRKVTWEKALAVLWAKAMWSTNSDNFTLVTVMLNPSSGGWEYEYRYSIFEQFIAIPGAIECIKNGLEQIFDYYDDPSEAQEECRGLFELVQSTTGRAIGTGTIDLRFGVQRQLAKAS